MPSKSLELFLGPTHWLDAFHLPVEEHFAKIIETVGHLLGADARPLNIAKL